MNKLYVLLIALSLFLLTLDRVFVLDRFRWGAQSLFTPVTYQLYRGGVETRYWLLFVGNLPMVYRENRELRVEIASLSQMVAERDELRRENKALKDQIGVAGASDQKKLITSVLGLVEEGYSILIVLDQGEVDGVKIGQVVVTGDSLVGRVVRTTGNHSYVLPLFAVDSKVPVEIITASEQRSKGLVKGEFNRGVHLIEVVQEERVSKGDVVVSSGEGGVYPAGLVVGKVEEVVAKDNEVFKEAKMQMVWDITDLKNAFILLE